MLVTFTLQSLDNDYSCMKDLYTQTNGQQWKNNTNWNTDSNDSTVVCSFYGITCDLNKTIVQAINLQNNNLQGSLPQCFVDLQLVELNLDNNDLSQTNMSGEFINNIKYSLSMQNTHAAFSGNVQFNGEKIYMINTDLSQLTLNLTSVNLSAVNLTNSSVCGTIQPSKYQNVRDFLLANTNLDVQLDANISSYTQTIDASNTSTMMLIQDVVNVWNQVPTLHILSLKNCKISGINDNFEGELYSEDSTRLIDLSGNPLFCGVNFTSPIECVFVQAKQVQVDGNKTQITFTHNKRVQQAAVPEQVEFYARENGTVNSPVQFQNCSFVSVKDYMFTYECNSQQFGIYNMSQIGIRMNGTTVSTGDVFVIDELNQLLGQTKTANRVEKKQEGKLIRNPRNHKQAVKYTPSQVQHDKYIQMEITAYSKCPDFKSLQESILTPFRVKYPDIAQYINYDYVSMATVNRQYFTQANSMHGLYEAYTDLLYVCLQDKVDNYLLWQIIDCQQENDMCIDLVPDQEERLDVKLCQGNEEGLHLLSESEQRLAQLNSKFSPAIFFNGQHVCDWDSYDEVECRTTSFEDVDQFAKYVCNYNTDMKQTSACSDFIQN